MYLTKFWKKLFLKIQNNVIQNIILKLGSRIKRLQLLEHDCQTQNMNKIIENNRASLIGLR
jgi:hypothetical protein